MKHLVLSSNDGELEVELPPALFENMNLEWVMLYAVKLSPSYLPPIGSASSLTILDVQVKHKL